MTRARARGALLALVVAFALAVLWPGVTLANRFRPTVLGLPLVLAWVALWIVIAMVVLLIIDHGLRGGAGSDAARKR